MTFIFNFSFLIPENQLFNGILIQNLATNQKILIILTMKIIAFLVDFVWFDAAITHLFHESPLGSRRLNTNPVRMSLLDLYLVLIAFVAATLTAFLVALTQI